jgi:hypothetical protein
MTGRTVVNPGWTSIDREVIQKLVPPANFGH